MEDDTPRRPGNLGPLYTLLDEAFPRIRNEWGYLDVKQVAEHIGVTHQAMYGWFKKNSIQGKFATKLIDLSKGTLKREDFLPFFF